MFSKIKLSDVVLKLETGGRPRGGSVDEGIPSLGAEHLNNEGGFSLDLLKYVPAKYFEEMNRGKISSNEILIVKDGATTGKTSFVNDNFPFKRAAVNEHVFKLTIDSNRAIPKFIFYVLFSPWGQAQILKDFRGATVGGITRNFMEIALVPLPPIPIQTKIVAILDQAQELINKRKQQIELLDEFLQSVFLDMFGDPVHNSKGWHIAKLSELGELQRGKSTHRPRNDPLLLGGPYPLIQTGDVSKPGLYIEDYSQTYSEFGLAQSKMWSAGTLCITIAANIAKTGILTFDACFPDSVVAFLPKERTNSHFIQFWFIFLQEIIEANAPVSAQKNINLRILRGLDVICPPIKLQEEFAKIVEKTETVRNSMTEGLKELQNLFNSLMQRAFKGELFS